MQKSVGRFANGYAAYCPKQTLVLMFLLNFLYVIFWTINVISEITLI